MPALVVLRRAAVAVALLSVLAGCGDDEDGSGAPTTTSVEEGLPPAEAVDLEPLYGAGLADLGLRLTPRGGLIDRSGGGYEPSATGTHLALYVEPIGDRTMQEYVDGIHGVTVLFHDVFDRWPDLETFDVCQEPVADAGSTDEPPPVTQIELTRAEAAAIDWSSVTAADLVGAALDDPPGLILRVSDAVATDPAYVALTAAT